MLCAGFLANHADHKHLLIEVASINSQEDLDLILDGEIKDIEKDPNLAQYPEETETVETVDPMTGAKVARIRVLEYENPYQLLGDCSGVPGRLWNMSPNAWVNVGPETFVLTFKKATFKIEKSPKDGLYRCERRITLNKEMKEDVAEASARTFKNGIFTSRNDFAARTMEKRPGRGETRFKSKGTMLPIESDSLRDCLHGVDTWIAKNIGHQPELIGRKARWRGLPASDPQLKFLKILGYHHSTGSDEGGDGVASQGKQRQQRPLTKGEAANMITRLINGAGKRWEESKKYRIKRAKELAKDIGVDVGPIPKLVDV